MSVLTGNPISSNRLTWSKKDRVLACELSDLHGHEHRVYDDACDVGVTVLSEATGREVVFVESHREYDREGDLMWIDYIPARRCDRNIKATLRAFND